MCRTVLIAFALTVLSVSAANGSPDLSAKPHRATAPVSASHKAKHPSNHATARTPGHAGRRVSGQESVHEAARKSSAAAHAHRASPRQPFRFHPAGKSAKFDSPAKFQPIAPPPPAEEINTESRQATPKTVSRSKAWAAKPSPLRGSYASLERQNEKTENDNLERIEDDDDLADRIARKMLVPVPASASLIVNGNLPENYRYCRPWTADFLTELARIHAVAFHRPLEVSSAVRTVEYQKHLMLTNGNATAAEGEIASPHLTGATIDIVKHGMSRQEMAWMRNRLLLLQQAGMIDVEEEFRQACFHITVYRSYVPLTPAVTGKPKRHKSPQPVQIAARAR